MPPYIGVATNTLGPTRSGLGFCRAPASDSDSESTTGPLYAVDGRSNGWKAPAQDAAACVAIYRPYVEDTTISWEIEVPTVDEMAARIAGLRASHEWLVLERDDEIVGFAYAQPLKRLAALRWSAETGICAGNGFHPSFGFEHVGLYRRVERNPCSRHNVAWMQLELLDGADRDAAPRPIT